MTETDYVWRCRCLEEKGNHMEAKLAVKEVLHEMDEHK
jgi:hypothetical protein